MFVYPQAARGPIGKGSTLLRNTCDSGLRPRLPLGSSLYLVDAPDRQGAPDILVSRKGSPVFHLSKDTTAVYDGDGHRVVYEWNRGTPGAVSYAGYDPPRQAWIEVVDFGADGVADLRTTEISGRQVKKEMAVGGRWLEFVTRDRKPFVLLDGKFISIDDARRQLGGTAGRKDRRSR